MLTYEQYFIIAKQNFMGESVCARESINMLDGLPLLPCRTVTKPFTKQNHSTRNPYEFFIHNNHHMNTCMRFSSGHQPSVPHESNQRIVMDNTDEMNECKKREENDKKPTVRLRLFEHDYHIILFIICSDFNGFSLSSFSCVCFDLMPIFCFVSILSWSMIMNVKNKYLYIWDALII